MSDIHETDEQLRQVYGPDAVFTRVGNFTLVHLDNPCPNTIARRVNEFDPREFSSTTARFARRAGRTEDT